MSTAVFWFCRDLRLADNPGLTAACGFAERVIPLCIAEAAIRDAGATPYAQKTVRPFRTGPRFRLHAALKSESGPAQTGKQGKESRSYPEAAAGFFSPAAAAGCRSTAACEVRTIGTK